MIAFGRRERFRHGPARRGASGSDDGSAIVEFVLAVTFVLVMLAAVVQLALVLHIRAVLIDCAGMGARHGALSGEGIEAASDRTMALVRTAVPNGDATVSARSMPHHDGELIEVTVTTVLPIVGFAGLPDALTVTGHAIREPG